ncbi:hypothetical protein HMPREF9004_1121 [Schaalia cardiffensis F0333]|uniref:Uncharacterized protein n=1 Tax=Schaalia cardiffensis F0333 TaxID=888050 RepID=N6W6E0_9ACTO|nr:hypothetical protein HMPREF9004_1121 [Schaalia cardiffensis F0333]
MQRVFSLELAEELFESGCTDRITKSFNMGRGLDSSHKIIATLVSDRPGSASGFLSMSPGLWHT